MRKIGFVLLIIALLISVILPIPVNATTSPFPFPNTIIRGSLFFGTVPNDISVHIYSKCFDSTGSGGPYHVEFLVQYDNEDTVDASTITNITADGGVTNIGSDSRTTPAGSAGSPTQTLVPIQGNASTYSDISVDVTVNGSMQSLPLTGAGCGPSNVSLSSASASTASQGWLWALPLALLGLATAVFLRRRVQA